MLASFSFLTTQKLTFFKIVSLLISYFYISVKKVFLILFIKQVLIYFLMNDII